jgi:predicted nucleic acid-binding protein
MVTLFDTNTLIDAFDPASSFHDWARRTLHEALSHEGSAVNPVIVAELCVGDRSPGTVAGRLGRLGFVFLDLPCAASERAAEAFTDCLLARRESGSTTDRKVPLPDFFIGAHAELLNLTVASADASRYRTYFPAVKLLTPEPSR